MTRLVPALVLALVPGLAHAGDFKAAYVDLQRAVQEVDEGKAAMGRLKSVVEAKQKNLEKEQEQLKKEKETFEKQAATMSDETRNKSGQELQKKLIDFQQRFEAGRAELAGLERKELSAIAPKMEALLGQLAQKEGLTMVFDKSSSGLAWAPASLDLTNELIRAYNSTYGSGGKAGPAPKSDAPKAGPAPKADAPKK